MTWAVTAGPSVMLYFWLAVAMSQLPSTMYFFVFFARWMGKMKHSHSTSFFPYEYALSASNVGIDCAMPPGFKYLNETYRLRSCCNAAKWECQVRENLFSLLNRFLVIMLAQFAKYFSRSECWKELLKVRRVFDFFLLFSMSPGFFRALSNYHTVRSNLLFLFPSVSELRKLLQLSSAIHRGVGARSPVVT